MCVTGVARSITAFSVDCFVSFESAIGCTHVRSTTPGIVVIARVSLTNFIYVAVLGCNQSGKLAASGELLYAAWKSMPVFRTGTN